MNATRLIAVSAIVLVIGCNSHAAEVPAGAASCSGCHATNVRTQTPVPPLKGQADDIAGLMAEYKTGKRPGTIMDRIAKGFSDEETKAIAAWFAVQK